MQAKSESEAQQQQHTHTHTRRCNHAFQHKRQAADISPFSRNSAPKQFQSKPSSSNKATQNRPHSLGTQTANAQGERRAENVCNSMLGGEKNAISNLYPHKHKELKA